MDYKVGDKVRFTEKDIKESEDLFLSERMIKIYGRDLAEKMVADRKKVYVVESIGDLGDNSGQIVVRLVGKKGAHQPQDLTKA